MDRRILVVDDDAPTRTMIAAVLAREAFAVDLCEDAVGARAHLNERRYDVVVLSLVQRDPEGDAAILEHLGAQAVVPAVVVLSAGSQAAMERFDSTLIRARLRKPFQIMELVGAVKDCIDK